MKSYIKHIILFFFIFPLITNTSCVKLKEVPIQNIEKIIYKDSIVFLHDSITIHIPHETIIEIIPLLDTSFLKTSFAESTAFIDTSKKKINHTLTQTGELNVIYDTIIKFNYKESIIEKEIPVEVEIIKYKRDTFFWVLLGWAVFCFLIAVIKLKR